MYSRLYCTGLYKPSAPEGQRIKTGLEMSKLRDARDRCGQIAAQHCTYLGLVLPSLPVTRTGVDICTCSRVTMKGDKSDE